MTEDVDEVPEVPAWRLFLITGMLVAIYLALVAVDDSGFRPLLLGAARSAVVGLSPVSG